MSHNLSPGSVAKVDIGEIIPARLKKAFFVSIQLIGHVIDAEFGIQIFMHNEGGFEIADDKIFPTRVPVVLL